MYIHSVSENLLRYNRSIHCEKILHTIVLQDLRMSRCLFIKMKVDFGDHVQTTWPEFWATLTAIPRLVSGRNFSGPGWASPKFFPKNRSGPGQKRFPKNRPGPKRGNSFGEYRPNQIGKNYGRANIDITNVTNIY